MSTTVHIDQAEQDLRALLGQLHLGETITLVGDEGVPEALLVSLRSQGPEPLAAADWDRRWDELARKVSGAWQSEKSALEILTEMRR